MGGRKEKRCGSGEVVKGEEGGGGGTPGTPHPQAPSRVILNKARGATIKSCTYTREGMKRLSPLH